MTIGSISGGHYGWAIIRKDNNFVLDAGRSIDKTTAKVTAETVFSREIADKIVKDNPRETVRIEVSID